MLDVALAIGFAVAAAAALWRLGPFHPATLWLGPWALATALFAMKALPYRELSTPTVLIIAGWSALFCAGTLLAASLWDRQTGRAGGRHVRSWLARRAIAEPRHVSSAAALAAALAAAGLLVFLAQVASIYGLRSAIVSDAYVRIAISEGATAYTIKYIYIAFAAATLAGLAAGRATSGRSRRVWIALAVVMVAIQYFSTGRSNILLAAVMASVAYFLADPHAVSRTRILRVAGVIAIVSVVVFLGMGSLLGKSFDASDVRTFDNAFLRHEALQPLALPYQYVTAPVPAFDVVRRVTPDNGRGGCMTLRPACSVGQRLGLPTTPEPSLTGFTGGPSAWNTFTALYAPLVDAGPLLGSLIILAEGLLFGVLWAMARGGSVYAVSTYAVMSAAIVYSTVENTMLQPHLIGAALIAVVVTAAAAGVDSVASARAGRFA